MKKVEFDISVKRFDPGWLLLGVLVGRALGLVGGMNFSFWYFASPGALIFWQVFGAVVCALFTSFLMTSRATLHLKGALLGMGICFAIVLYSGEIWALLQTGRSSSGLAGMRADEGIFFEWILLHSAWLGIIAGWIVGALISRRNRNSPDESENSHSD
jgi:hypothetical protein